MVSATLNFQHSSRVRFVEHKFLLLMTWGRFLEDLKEFLSIWLWKTAYIYKPNCLLLFGKLSYNNIMFGDNRFKKREDVLAIGIRWQFGAAFHIMDLLWALDIIGFECRNGFVGRRVIWHMQNNENVRCRYVCRFEIFKIENEKRNRRRDNGMG